MKELILTLAPPAIALMIVFHFELQPLTFLFGYLVASIGFLLMIKQLET